MIILLIIGPVIILGIGLIQWKRIYPFAVRNEDMIDEKLAEEERLTDLAEQQRKKNILIEMLNDEEW